MDEQSAIELLKKGSLTKEVLEENPSLKNSIVLLSSVIDIEPDLIRSFYASSFSKDNIIKLTHSSFMPTSDDMIRFPIMRLSDDLVEKAFQQDPHNIVYMSKDMLTESTCADAVQRGYVLTAQDVQQNNFLLGIPSLMETAINDDPDNIKHLMRNVHVRPSVIYDSISKMRNMNYEYLSNNPTVCQNHEVMEVICDLYPELKIFKTDLSDGEKKEYLVGAFKQYGLDAVNHLPYLETRFGFNKDITDVNSFLEFATINFDDSKLTKKQKEAYYSYYRDILDHIIDALVDERYHKKKSDTKENELKYKDIATVDKYFKTFFAKIPSDHTMTIEAEKLCEYLNIKDTDKDKVRDELNSLYHEYLKTKTIAREHSTPFYNMILNDEANIFKQNSKRSYHEYIISRLKLTKKMHDQIVKAAMFKRFQKAIREDNYNSIGLNKDKFINDVLNAKVGIRNSAILKNNHVELSDYDFALIENAFIFGRLDESFLRTIVSTANPRFYTNMIGRYNQIIGDAITSIQPRGEDNVVSIDQKFSIPLNTHNFIFADIDRYYNTLADIIIDTDNATFNKILKNKYDAYDMNNLLPFGGIHPEFKSDDIISILSNYSRIKKHLGDEDPLKHFNKVYSYAKGYASSNDLIEASLNKKVIDQVHNYNASKYLNFYLGMLNKNTSSVPSIQGNYHGQRYETCNYHDLDRLLIGTNFGYSCIDLLNPAGLITYDECLTKDSGDVLIIKDDKGNFIGRSLVFRRGNCVVLGHIRTDSHTEEKEFYTPEFINNVARDIMESAKEKNDNVEYVLLDTSFAPKLNYKVIDDNRMSSELPHADFADKVYLIGGEYSEDIKDKMNFNGIVLPKYPLIHNAVETEPTLEELTRIKALAILEEEDTEKRKNDMRNFEGINKKDGLAFKGDDWYIIQGSEMDAVILPSSDDEQKEEFELYKEKLCKNMAK